MNAYPERMSRTTTARRGVGEVRPSRGSGSNSCKRGTPSGSEVPRSLCFGMGRQKKERIRISPANMLGRELWIASGERACDPISVGLADDCTNCG